MTSEQMRMTKDQIPNHQNDLNEKWQNQNKLKNVQNETK